jgi:hypothetical protein
MHLFCPFAGKFYGRNKNDQDSFLAQIGKAVALGALWGEVWQSSHKWTPYALVLICSITYIHAQ